VNPLDSLRAACAPYLLSVLRIVLGLLYMQHGLSKLLAFPSPAPPNFQMLSLLGLAGILETFGGLLITIGLFTSPVAFILSGEMAFAYFMQHFPRAWLPALNAGNLAVLYCFVYLYLAAAGGGPWSVDALRARSARSGSLAEQM
jgi:putative oxidoreductase